MAETKKQRVRDPVHGLIVFENEGDDKRRDQTAWKLLNTPEFQRLRRIRQLGLSEFTFPGATHTRFAHSVGVFNTARILVGILKRLLAGDFDSDRASIAVLAALVHDLGHGPFSHAFESVQMDRGSGKDHEVWSGEIILNEDGRIFEILEKFRPGIADEIAKLLTARDPKDIYHAIVSSSFDADRLDYFRRDRLMTGTGAGAIDFDWLLDNLDIAEISRAPDDEEESETIQTFCLGVKALQAAEAFLLARYHLFEQVYLHKTTRGLGVLLSVVLGRVADAAVNKEEKGLGLDASNPLVRFYRKKGAAVANYLALDDFQIWTTLGRIADCKDRSSADLARRLREREPYRALDIDTEFPRQSGESADQIADRRTRASAKIEESVQVELNRTVFKDTAAISVYGEIGADQTKAHKMLSIKPKDGKPREITQLSPTIRSLSRERTTVRFYFETDSAREAALAVGKS